MTAWHAKGNWNFERDEQVKQNVAQIVIGIHAIAHYTENNPSNAVKSACVFQLRDHSVDSVWGLAGILKEQDTFIGVHGKRCARGRGDK